MDFFAVELSGWVEEIELSIKAAQKSRVHRAREKSKIHRITQRHISGREKSVSARKLQFEKGIFCFSLFFSDFLSRQA